MKGRLVTPYVLGLIVALITFIATLAIVGILRGASRAEDMGTELVANRVLHGARWQTIPPSFTTPSISHSLNASFDPAFDQRSISL